MLNVNSRKVLEGRRARSRAPWARSHDVPGRAVFCARYRVPGRLGGFGRRQRCSPPREFTGKICALVL